MEKKEFDINEIIKQLKENKHLSIDEIEEILCTRKYLNIDEMAQILEEPKHTLRFWETEYNLKIQRHNSNIRKYVSKNIIEFRKIQFLRRTQNLTTDGTKDKLIDGKKVDAERNITEILKNIRQELVKMRKDLNYQPTFSESVVIS